MSYIRYYVCVVYLVFEQYQKSRMQFVQTVADLSSRPQNIDTLQTAGEELFRQDVGGAGCLTLYMYMYTS